MIVENAWVQSIENNQITLQTIRSASCQTCKAKSGCGQAIMSKVNDEQDQQKKNNITIQSDESVQIGEEVELILPEHSLVKAALIMYLMPLLTMFGFAAVLAGLNYNDATVSIGALFGLGFGFLLIKTLNKKIKHDEQFEPKLRKKRIQTA